MVSGGVAGGGVAGGGGGGVLKVRLTSFTFLSSGMRLRQIIVG